MLHQLARFTLAVALATAAPVSLAPADFRVVVHADNPVESISQEDLARIFLRKTRLWDHGVETYPIDGSANSAVRAAFTRAIHDKSITAVKSYWGRRVMAGREVPPPELGSDDLVLAAVEQHPGAVGYVAASTPLGYGVKVLAISGRSDHFADPVAHEGGGHRAATEVVARHGDMRLVLTSSCGPDGQGRRAVLENRADEVVWAKIETSIWKGAWFRSSAVARHMVFPGQEKALGCTRRSDSAEKRFAIVEVSNAASHGVGGGHHERSARDAVSVVRSGSCGQRRKGQNMALINRHPHSAIAVSVQYVDKVDGQIQRRYSKRYVLAPGSTRQLGCSADGKLERTFEVTEANYR